jgi:hypothetical protein
LVGVLGGEEKLAKVVVEVSRPDELEKGTTVTACASSLSEPTGDRSSSSWWSSMVGKDVGDEDGEGAM